MYDRNYYLAHREKILAQGKKWREENSELYKKIYKRSFRKNLLKNRVKQKLYRCANWDKIQKKHQEYIDNNREKILAYKRIYRAINRRKLRAYNVRYKANKRYSNIQNWAVYYQNQNGRFKWSAIRNNYQISDDKINGFPTLRSAQMNAKFVLG